MSEVTTIGLDIAKHVFQIHGVDDTGAVVIRRKLRRAEILQFFEALAPYLVGSKPARQHTIGRDRSWRWGTG